MKHLETIMRDMYTRMEGKEIFIPIVIANALLVYKLSHDDETYWKNFSERVISTPMHSIQDMYLFFIDFLPETSQFSESYNRKIDHLKDFRPYIEELYHKQKYYAKNPDSFVREIQRGMETLPNPELKTFSKKIFDMARKIRFDL